MISLAVATIAFGLIVIIEPAAFDGTLELSERREWFYTIIGLVSHHRDDPTDHHLPPPNLIGTRAPT